jgi:hypothetical protein
VTLLVTPGRVTVLWLLHLPPMLGWTQPHLCYLLLLLLLCCLNA